MGPIMVCFDYGTIYHYRQIPDDDPIGGAFGLEFKTSPAGFLRGARRRLRRHAAGARTGPVVWKRETKRPVASAREEKQATREDMARQAAQKGLP